MMSKRTTDLSAIVAHVASHPTDEVRWLVLADWFDERGDNRGVDIRRWWKVRAELIRAWGTETPDADQDLEEAAAACVGLGGEWWRLCACLNWRLCRERWPVPYDGITTWPDGWSSARHEAAVESAAGHIELAVFGIGDLRPVESVARAAAESAVAAAMSARTAESAAAMSAAMSARTAESAAWVADSAVAEWLLAAAAATTTAVAWSVEYAAAAAEVTKTKAAAKAAAARLYLMAAELLRDDGG